MTAEILELTQSNRALLENVAPGVFDNSVDPIQLEAFLKCPRHMMAIAVNEHMTVGMTSAVEYFHPDKKPQLWINEVAVASEYQNQGIGRRLVKFIIHQGRERGCVSAWLGTDANNFPAQRCFDSVAGGELPSSFLLYQW